MNIFIIAICLLHYYLSINTHYYLNMKSIIELSFHSLPMSTFVSTLTCVIMKLDNFSLLISKLYNYTSRIASHVVQSIKNKPFTEKLGLYLTPSEPHPISSHFILHQTGKIFFKAMKLTHMICVDSK